MMLRRQKQGLLLELRDRAITEHHKRCEAERERDEALADNRALWKEVLRLRARELEDGRVRFWQAIAQRNADEATAYAVQLRSKGLAPNRDFGREEASSTW